MCHRCTAIAATIKIETPWSLRSPLEIDHAGDVITLRGRCDTFTAKKDVQDAALRIAGGQIDLRNRIEVADWIHP